MKYTLYIILLTILFFGCQDNPKTEQNYVEEKQNFIDCDNSGCRGIYTGPEFIKGEDIAHQFSNKMARVVGDQLKVYYREKNYKMVDFSGIEMSTEGMGSGKVVYQLKIPFTSVDSKCEAFTAFDHVGGWNHKPALRSRKKQLKKATLKGHQLDISPLNKTPEGLQEYWIQWKHKTIQSECE